MSGMRELWVRWKMLRLPWRKKFLIGQDLAGNTFWEFKDALNHNRWRRIVQASSRTHFADVQISPQWHQWLRQTRLDPPSLEEQTADLQRQAVLKHNARLADERWAAKAKYIEKPPSKPAPALASSHQDAARPDTSRNDTAAPAARPSQGESRRPAVNETATNPGSTWAPEAWVPGSAKR